MLASGSRPCSSNSECFDSVAVPEGLTSGLGLSQHQTLRKCKSRVHFAVSISCSSPLTPFHASPLHRSAWCETSFMPALVVLRSRLQKGALPSLDPFSLTCPLDLDRLLQNRYSLRFIGTSTPRPGKHIKYVRSKSFACFEPHCT